MPCPECRGLSVFLIKKISDGSIPPTEREEYVCDDCDCEFEWRMEMKITKHGNTFLREGEDD